MRLVPGPLDMDVTRRFALFCPDSAVIYEPPHGGKEFYPLTPGILTCDLSGLPLVFIGTVLFMLGSVLPQIFGYGAAFLGFFLEKVGACVGKSAWTWRGQNSRVLYCCPSALLAWKEGSCGSVE